MLIVQSFNKDAEVSTDDRPLGLNNEPRLIQRGTQPQQRLLPCGEQPPAVAGEEYVVIEGDKESLDSPVAGSIEEYYTITKQENPNMNTAEPAAASESLCPAE